MKRARARRCGLLVGTPLLAAAILPAVAGRPLWIVLAALCLCLVAVAIAVHDLTTMLIPDLLTAALAALALIVQALEGWWPSDMLRQAALAFGLAAALFALSLAYAALRGQTGVGFGDVKLIAASGLLVGVWGVGMQLLLASVAAIAFVLIRAIRRRRPLSARMRVPFGAFLAPAAVLVWAWLPT